MDEKNKQERKYSVLDNSYKSGDKLPGDDFQFYSSIKIDEVGASIYMRDSFSFDALLFGRMVNYANKIIDENQNISEMINRYENETVKKVKTEDINELFSFFYIEFSKSKEFSEFINISYIIEIISNLTETTYDVIFNSLIYDNKVIVLESLSHDVDLF